MFNVIMQFLSCYLWKRRRQPKMKATIRTFQSGAGDCIFFSIDNDEKRYVTLIDCGQYTADIKRYVEDELDKHINILVVTHIDNDHIDGLVEMLEQTPDVKIDKILYNCNQLWNGHQRKLPNITIQQDIQNLRNCLPSRAKSENGKIKADKAVTLAEKLAEKEEWWEAWKKNEYITSSTKAIPLNKDDKRFGKLVVLTPTRVEIEKLNKKFKTEYARLTKHILAEGETVLGQETLFELVERVAAMKRRNYEVMRGVKTGATLNLLEEARLSAAFDFEPKGVSDENEASIALMWEYGDSKVLFMGDAEPDDISARIEAVYGEGMIVMKAIKVSHHGSKHSTSKELMKHVDSDHYFFTGGNLSDKPSLEAIAKIVKRDDTKRRTLHFNNKGNKNVKALNSEQGTSMREHYHITIAENNECQFEY